MDVFLPTWNAPSWAHPHGCLLSVDTPHTHTVATCIGGPRGKASGGGRDHMGPWGATRSRKTVHPGLAWWHALQTRGWLGKGGRSRSLIAMKTLAQQGAALPTCCPSEPWPMQRPSSSSQGVFPADLSHDVQLRGVPFIIPAEPGPGDSIGQPPNSNPSLKLSDAR